MAKINALQVYLQGRLFLLFYRVILIKKEFESLIFTGLKILRDYYREEGGTEGSHLLHSIIIFSHLSYPISELFRHNV